MSDDVHYLDGCVNRQIGRFWARVIIELFINMNFTHLSAHCDAVFFTQSIGPYFFKDVYGITVIGECYHKVLNNCVQPAIQIAIQDRPVISKMKPLVTFFKPQYIC